MYTPDFFNLDQSTGVLRWNNATEFLKVACYEPKEGSEVLLAFLTFNASLSAIDVLKKIKADNACIDILIIDNSSETEHYNALKKETLKYHNVTLIQTTCNLGGAGGYALINELFLRSRYKYLLLTEDDASPVEPDLVSKLIEAKDESDMVGCHYYNNRSLSFSFHFTLYSRRLIDAAGIPDPRFFQGGDDAEIRDRHLSALNSFGKTVFIVDRGYHHPTLKGMGTPAKVIRSQRNSILADISNKKYINFIVRVFGLTAYSILNLFIGRREAFWVGITSFLTIRNMDRPGCSLLKLKSIHESLDKDLNFKEQPTSSISGRAVNPHIASLLQLPLQKIGSNSVVVATLDSPWLIKDLLISKFLFVAKDLSVDMTTVRLAKVKPSLWMRLSNLLSVVLASFLSPFVVIAYLYFSINHY